MKNLSILILLFIFLLGTCFQSCIIADENEYDFNRTFIIKKVYSDTLAGKKGHRYFRKAWLLSATNDSNLYLEYDVDKESMFNSHSVGDTIALSSIWRGKYFQIKRKGIDTIQVY